LNLHDLRQRPLGTLSGGQQQRVAIGAVLTASPSVLVLDEPTSALDPAAAEEVLAALTRLVHDIGTTVLIAEHRLERVVQYCDQVVVLDRGAVASGEPSSLLGDAPIAPPIVELGREVGWSPLPLSIRDARRVARPLRDELQAVGPPTNGHRTPGDRVASVEGLHVSYGPVAALRGVELELRTGEVVALMGRNGSGKSSLLAQLVGLRAPSAGRVRLGEDEPHRLKAREVLRHAGLVPQDPSLLLYGETVAEECAAADHDTGQPAGTTARLVEELVGELDPARHPRDLSEGQRLGLALAVVLAARPPLLLLDEPTRGLDYAAKRRLGEVVDRLAAAGHGIVLATHDVEVVAQWADRVVVLADGEVVADGPARDVVCHSPVFAPQVAKILAPEPWLTVDEVRAARRRGSRA
jgi:energy-coupling factor transport system ATP-binding protein